MNWSKPRNIWQWLLLLTPAVAAMLAMWVATTFAPVPPIEYQGRQIPNVGGVIGQGLSVTGLAIGAVSMVLAFPFSVGSTRFKRTLSALGIFCWLFVVNACVAFSGCTAISLVDYAIDSAA